MARKRVRNAFYFYTIDFREEQKLNGVEYENMSRVIDAAGVIWKNAPEEVKQKYREIALKDREKKMNRDIPCPVVHDESYLRDRELRQIENLIRIKCFDEEILFEDFYVLDVSVFCKTPSGSYLIAESTVLRFSLYEGIKDYYHDLIHPGEIPIKYMPEAKLGSKSIGLELSNDMQKKSCHVEVLENITSYLKKQLPDSSALPPVYTLPNKIDITHNFIQQICRATSESPNKFVVRRLDMLFYAMSNALLSKSMLNESQALAKLVGQTFEFFTPKMCCKEHDIADKAIQCTTTHVKCWAYAILGECCPSAGLDLKVDSHVPDRRHLEDILIFNMQPRERRIPNKQLRRHATANNNQEMRGIRRSYDARKSNEPLRAAKSHGRSRGPTGHGRRGHGSGASTSKRDDDAAVKSTTDVPMPASNNNGTRSRASKGHGKRSHVSSTATATVTAPNREDGGLSAAFARMAITKPDEECDEE